MQVQFWAATDVGLTRDHNEDNYLVDPNLSLFVVADGMGGHAAGEIASSVAVHEVREALKKQREVIEAYKKSGSVLQRQTVLTLIEQAISTACSSVYQCAQEDSERHGMGTTLSLLLLARNRAFVGHVGDSRIYRTRGGKLTQITEDHTVVNELIKSGRIKPDEAFNSPYKNAVTRAVGVHPSVEVDTFDFEVKAEDNYLLCSDGLSGYLEEEPDAETLRYLEQSDVKQIPQALIDFANDSGGKDNITAIVIRVDAIEGPKMSTGFGLLPPIPKSSAHPLGSDFEDIDDLEVEESLLGGTEEGLEEVQDIDESGLAPPPIPLHNEEKVKHQIRPAAQELGELPVNLLKVSPLFGLLDQESIEAFVAAGEILSLKPNQALHVIGDDDSALYFLYKGELRIENDEREIDLLTVGATIGEDQLLSSEQVTRNVIANTHCELLCWHQEVMRSVLIHSPEIAARMMWGLSLFHQRKIKRLNRSLHMLHELYSSVSVNDSSWQEQAQHLIDSSPSSNEVYAPLHQLPSFVRELPPTPTPTFNLGISEAETMIESELKEQSK